MTRRPTLRRVATACALGGAALLLTACASPPAPPDWQAHAFSALKGFSSAYLRGDTRLADLELARARLEISRTGRADVLARAELTRCAAQVASLEFDRCKSYQPLAADAGAPEQAYAAFLNGQWSGLNTALLPAHHRALVLRVNAHRATNPGTQPQSTPVTLTWDLDLSQLIEDPLARLVAAGVLLQINALSPADIATATETASNQGWRRPLLAWLGVQRQRASEAGEQAAAARIQRRMDLVLQGSPDRR